MSIRDDEPLVKNLLAEFPNGISIGWAAQVLGIPMRRVYAVVLANKGSISVVGIDGPMKTWCIGLDAERPIHFVLKKGEHS